jgi:hypothetical protein
MEKVNKTVWVPQAIMSVLLLWALYPGNPYGYYMLLRWICCAVFIYLAFEAHKRRRDAWVWVYGLIAVTYNPILRISFKRDMWSIVNIITVVIAIISIFILKKQGELNKG